MHIAGPLFQKNTFAIRERHRNIHHFVVLHVINFCGESVLSRVGLCFCGLVFIFGSTRRLSKAFKDNSKVYTEFYGHCAQLSLTLLSTKKKLCLNMSSAEVVCSK